MNYQRLDVTSKQLDFMIVYIIHIKLINMY
jgi:hypothetical protein